VWPCDVCGRPVEDGEGYLCVDLAAVREYERAAFDWEKRERAKCPGALFVYPLEALRDYPEPVPWQTLHRECDPAPESDDYHFDVSRFRTAEAVIRMAAHVGSKHAWITATNWNDLLGSAADEVARLAG
jgi:hypothetical protein